MRTNIALATSSTQGKRNAETLRKASLSAFSEDDICHLRNRKKRKAANCVLPTPASNNMRSFNKDMNGQTEAISNKAT